MPERFSRFGFAVACAALAYSTNTTTAELSGNEPENRPRQRRVRSSSLDRLLRKAKRR